MYMNKDDLSDEELYSGREQSLVKHSILKTYLERFAFIIGKRFQTISYVDCFSGPWNVKSDNFQDSSFYIALEELRKARQTHKNLKIRCFFLEKKHESYSKLKAFADKITDAEIITRNATLEDSIPNIVSFLTCGGTGSFSFIFIDPTGWTGFAMKKIAPLLQQERSEVLINFMTGDIYRFINSPMESTHESLKELFGTEDFIKEIQGREGHDREDAVVAKYREQIAKTGNFNFTATAMVLRPLINRSRFHLIYATRNYKGIQVFKEAEKKAMELQEQERAKAQQRNKENLTSQMSLLQAEDTYNPSFSKSLRNRYLDQARYRVMDTLKKKKSVPYDKLWEIALWSPLVWESDLKAWIKEWEKNHIVIIKGKKPNRRVPHLNEGNILEYQGSS